MLKNYLKRLRHRLTLRLFNYFFSDLILNFEDADKGFDKLSETQRMQYYEAISAWVESQAYEIEDKGKIGDCARQLAFVQLDPDVHSAYRLAILLMKNQDIRLRSKVAEYQSLKAARKAFNQVNRT